MNRFNPADLFAEGLRSLPKQASAVKGREQSDGWGAASYSAAGELRIVKSPKPVYTESERFTRAVSVARCGFALAHIRQASNIYAGVAPKGYITQPANPPVFNRKELTSTANTQPFSGNGFVFAHNGTLEIPAEIKTTLGKYERFVKGVNDSEVLFWQIMKMLDAYGDPALALEMAAEETRTVWLSVKDRYPKKKNPYHGLNIFLSDGKALWALCHYPANAKKEALMTPGWEFGRIAWKKDSKKIIFASEPLDAGPWHKMSDWQIAEARMNGGSITLKIKTLNRFDGQ
ncbi:MAG: class II glutamine amidotransferase [Elusimicrobiota bacterium]